MNDRVFSDIADSGEYEEEVQKLHLSAFDHRRIVIGTKEENLDLLILFFSPGILSDNIAVFKSTENTHVLVPQGDHKDSNNEMCDNDNIKDYEIEDHIEEEEDAEI